MEEKFAYAWSIKKHTVADEVLFSARLSGAQAAAETSIRILNTQCVDMAQKYCFHFIHEMNIEHIIKAPVLNWEPFKWA